MSTLERAIAIAAEAHASQTDKAGEPYLLHVMRVVLGVRSEKERIVAALHDVVEDDPDENGRRIMVAPWPADILAAIDAITHRKGEPYDGYIERVASNPLARAVKLADLADNMDTSRLPVKDQRTEDTMSRWWKYKQAAERLSRP